MNPKRLSIKIFAANPDVVSAAAFMPVFQRWIQRKSVEGLLIDVADYKHVPNGPGMVLIGHEGDYSYNYADGRPGILYVLKIAPSADLAVNVAVALKRAVQAAQLIEGEKRLGGLKFGYNEVQIGLLDRLRTPNTPETWEAVTAELAGPLAELFGAAPELSLLDDNPRAAQTIQVRAAGPVEAAALLERLEKAAVQSA